MFVDASMSQEQISERYSQARDEVDNHPNVVVCKRFCGAKSIAGEIHTQVRQQQQQIIAHADRTLRHLRIPDAEGGSEIALWSRKHLCMH